MTKFKLFLISLYLTIPLSVFSQQQHVNNLFNKTLQKKAADYKNETNFKKSQFFFVKSNWDSTLVYAMKQIDSSKNKELADYCHFFRGSSFREKKLFKEAQSEMLLVSSKFRFHHLVYKNLGQISLELKEFNKAIQYFKEIEKSPIAKSQGYDVSVIYTNIGISYLHLNQFKKAEEYFFKSLKLQEKAKDSSLLISLYINIANLYYMQYKDNLAIPYFEKAYRLSTKVKDLDTKRAAAINMAAVEENRGNFKKALIYRKEYEQWKDSLNNQNKIWSVADYEKKYAVAQKQKQISVLNIENKLKNSQRNSIFYAALGLLALLIAAVLIYAQKVKNAKIILLQKNKLDELNTTKDQLFSIVSHDLRSSVNALKTSNTKLTNSLESKNYIELDQLLHQNSAIANGTYRLLDNLLHWAMLQTKQLYFNKDSIHLFAIVQQIEYNYKPLLADKSITFENTVSKNCFIFVDLDSIKIVLRNLLDNAIKFTPEKGKIMIYTQEAELGFWQLIIKDNGIGMSQNTITELLKDSELLAKKGDSEMIGTGLGMQLCKQMIKKNNGTLIIESEINKGTKIIISLPKTA